MLSAPKIQAAGLAGPANRMESPTETACSSPRIAPAQPMTDEGAPGRPRVVLGRH